MKACVIQPPYSMDAALSDPYFDAKLKLLDSCDDSLDLIVLPECSDVPCGTATREETLLYHEKYFGPLLNKCAETAKRCGAVVFANALWEENGKYRNTTFAFDRQGEIAGKYFKRHLPPFEREVLRLDPDYAMEYAEPDVLEIDGLRYGFLTCYDFYFYEAFANIARQNVDIIIGCSLQRSDSHDAIETMCKFLAYNTNAYVLRSSVSFSEDSEICGASMIVSPRGKVLANLKGKFGMATAEFDPKEKYFKPAGFGNPPAAHYEYIEAGRRPWLYRPAGPAMIRNEKTLPYPRVCAHRGFSVIAPENSMPAYGAAIALGAEEIELDLWPTADGEIVSCHDRDLAWISTGTGRVTDHTYGELLAFDFGVKFGEKFKGLRIVKFEEILKKFAGQVIMNVHVKPLDYDDTPYPEEAMKKIIALLKKYDADQHAYLLLETDDQIRQFKTYAPEVSVAVGHVFDRPWSIVDRAIEFGCEKVQLFKPYFTQEMIDKAHAHGIRCNVFFSDDPEETRKYLEMGCDTIMTNDFNPISQCVER